jgi:hypothetical protein
MPPMLKLRENGLKKIAMGSAVEPGNAAAE